ncbi:DUF3526 domain-containing protein [Methylobacterium sp. ap11]|uniref:DUF3526 domain-containing protein n=1 Tax=Methylobacterium sp. ap11 TaxID=1761799 RepID=UPI0015A5455A|nr:DUF3526 domain-containing protein [Methylobacterium sp. ap11]
MARDAFCDAAPAPRRYAARAHSTSAADWSGRLALLSPLSAFARALEAAAGSDAGRHAAFLATAADYRATLRTFFEPRILAQRCARQRSATAARRGSTSTPTTAFPPFRLPSIPARPSGRRS